MAILAGKFFTKAYQSGIEVSSEGIFTSLRRCQPDVFLSHKSEDKQATLAIAQALISQGMSAYIDYVDPQVHAQDPTLESYLREVIHNSRSLLTVATANTISSWWVPFEIGVALDNDKLVGTVLRGTPGQLPTYLLNWPVMESSDEAVAQQWQQYLNTTRITTARNVYEDWRQRPSTFNRNSQRWANWTVG